MKKSLLIPVIILLFFVSNIINAEEKEEMVVLFDTSVSVLPYFDLLSGHLIHDLIHEHLDEGDKFHMLSFDAEPHYEFSLAMKGEPEEERVISYISLLKPMGQYTDFVSALNYLYRFTKDLPLNTKKKILILSDGIHDPPPYSPLYGKEADYINEQIATVTEKIFREGWEVHLLKLPADEGEGLAATSDTSVISIVTSSSLPESSPEAPATGTSDNLKATGLDSSEIPLENETGEVSETEHEPDDNNYIDMISDKLDTPAVDLNENTENISNAAMGNVRLSLATFPDETGYSFRLEGLMENFGNIRSAFSVREILLDGENILEKRVNVKLDPGESSPFEFPLRIPGEIEPGAIELKLKFLFSNGSDISPDNFLIKTTLVVEDGKRFSPEIPVKLIGGIIVILILIILIVILFRFRTMERSLPAGKISSAKNNQQNIENEVNETIRQNRVSEKPSRSDKHEIKRSENTKTVKDKSPALIIPQSAVKPDAHKGFKKGKENISISSLKFKEEELDLTVEMHVVGQNPYKWSRNINAVTEAGNMSIGDRHDPYSIFIINIPRHVAEISFNGREYTFIPLQPGFFPELTEPLIDCLDKYIKVVDESGKQTRIVFRKWLPPVVKINRIMHLIDKPGLPDFHY